MNVYLIANQDATTVHFRNADYAIRPGMLCASRTAQGAAMAVLTSGEVVAHFDRVAPPSWCRDCVDAMR